MEWRDHGILLTVRRHGESSAIIEVFTEAHGRHAGVVRGGASRKVAPLLQPGAQLDVTWRARLDAHIGTFAVEPLRSRAAAAFSGRMALAGLNAVVALLSYGLPEREAHARLYRQTEQLMDLLGQDEIWPLAYLRWEQALLDDLGFGLDLAACAVTGATEGLVYVSPKSGRAVTAAGAGDWAARMLPLPPCLLGHGPGSDAEIVEALGTTGHFLESRLAMDVAHKPLPQARARLIDLLARSL